MQYTEQRERNLKIIDLVQEGIPYAEIGRQFNVTRQRIHQLRKRAQQRGVKLRDKRSPGSPKGLRTISSDVRSRIDLLCEYPNKTYAQLRKYDVTLSQLNYAYRAAMLRGISVRSGRERIGQSVADKLLPDLLNKELSITEIAEKHSTSRSRCMGYIHRTN